MLVRTRVYWYMHEYFCRRKVLGERIGQACAGRGMGVQNRTQTLAVHAVDHDKKSESPCLPLDSRSLHVHCIQFTSSSSVLFCMK